MKNKPYLKSILGGTDFRSLSIIEKIRYIRDARKSVKNNLTI